MSLLQNMTAQQLCHVETHTKITRHKMVYTLNIQHNVMWCNIMQYITDYTISSFSSQAI